MTERTIELEAAAQEIMAVLRRTKTPQHAAGIMALVRANLWFYGGGATEAKVRIMMADDDKIALEIWSTITEQHLAH